MHSQWVAFYMSCIQMHLYASTHKVHSVDTLHSDALAFLRIQAHSDAFTRTCIHLCTQMHSYAFACIRMHFYAFIRIISMYSYAFVCIRMHSHAYTACWSSKYLVLCSDGQPHLVASSLTDCAVMERFLLQASACFCFSRLCIILIWSTVLPAETMTVSSSSSSSCSWASSPRPPPRPRPPAPWHRRDHRRRSSCRSSSPPRGTRCRRRSCRTWSCTARGCIKS